MTRLYEYCRFVHERIHILFDRLDYLLETWELGVRTDIVQLHTILVIDGFTCFTRTAVDDVIANAASTKYEKTVPRLGFGESAESIKLKQEKKGL